jgi:octaprenyl-diphosphate synthase
MSIRLRPPVMRSVAALAAPLLSDLARVEDVLSRTLAPHRRQAADLIDHLEHYRGKRLRPLLLLFTAAACGGIRPVHHTLGAVVEMIHTATLVHDDVLDEADTRRHVDTVNARWGNKGAILLGDLLFTHAFHLAATTGDARACELIGEATNRVCAGELHQITQRGNLRLSEVEYFDIIDGKTAALTAVACQLGALYAHADEPRAELLANYGRCLGQAFQVADDLLDLLGEETTAGKTLGTDLEQQKLTLPLIHCLEQLPSERADELRATLAQPDAHTQARVLTALRHTDSLTYARQRAEELASEARHSLADLPDTDARQALELLTEWAIRREK